MKIFVYGTLRGLGSGKHIGEATIKGRLFKSKTWFPFATDGNRLIKGDIYEISGEELEEIDRYEGYDKTSVKKSLFIRKETTAVLHNGSKISVLVYFLNPSRYDSLVDHEILHGDWLRFIKSTT
jgi:gamma-glutamylcyclotransferase (GGCT)/AIG2-like uncharacterized protein YtfP